MGDSTGRTESSMPDGFVSKESELYSTSQLRKEDGGDKKVPTNENFKSVVSGVCWGWGWTNKPKEAFNYYLTEVAVGVIICFAQIPESVAFAFMANVEPMVALHAAWIVGVISSVLGGRPGMIHGATGAKATVISAFVICNGEEGCSFEENGVELLFLAVILSGLLNVVFSFLRLSVLLQLIPTPVMIGFCNGLGIIIGLAQLHPFKHGGVWVTGWEAFWMALICIAALLVMELWPRIPKVGSFIPSTLVSILVAVAIEFLIVRMAFGYETRTIKDVSAFNGSDRFPIPFFINKAYDMNVITQIDWPVFLQIIKMGFRLFAVGTLEELMTVEVMNDLHKNKGNGDQQMFASGLGNVVAGFFGTMGGNSMIGLSVMSYRSKAKGRESGVVTAIGVFIIVSFASAILNYIPIAALSGIMFVVVIHTIKWTSIPMVLTSFLPAKVRNLHPYLKRKIQRWDAGIIVIVSIVTPLVDLLLAVTIGASLAALVFVWESKRKFRVETCMDSTTSTKYYEVEGPLFYGARRKFESMFSVHKDPPKTALILKGNSSLFDYSAMESVNNLKRSYKEVGKQLKIHGLKSECIKMVIKANKVMEHVDIDLADMEIPKVYPLYTPNDQVESIPEEEQSPIDVENALSENMSSESISVESEPKEHQT